MNQQEFPPESQEQYRQAQQSEERYKTRQYKRRSSSMPKEEHPSAYEEAQPEYSYQGYQARDTSRHEKQQKQSTSRQAPPWTKPQQRSGSTKRWIKILLITLLIICAVPIILRIMLLLLTLFIASVMLILLLLVIVLIGFLYFKSQRQRWWRW